MAVKITLEFAGVDEAIVALGKLVGAKAAPQQPAAVPEKTRKSRSDAGQPRGPHKNAAGASAPAVATTPETGSNVKTAVTDPSKAEEKPATSTSTPAAAPGAPATSEAASKTAPAAPVPTLEQVQAAVEKLFAAKAYEGTLAALSRFGVKRGKDLLPEHRAEFIAKVDRIIAGEAI